MSAADFKCPVCGMDWIYHRDTCTTGGISSGLVVGKVLVNQETGNVAEPVDASGLTIWDAVAKCGLELEITDQAVKFSRGDSTVGTVSTESVAWTWLRKEGWIK